ncbi:MAG: queuosine biosynthesis protein [Candidatus Eremiobacter antarcticus]|nr:S-adenosylmethionine:tRNA ribosyltransferase-isomerase [Candidatus Eremiobacteraeota bacterium]MBC5807826.1 S-adenosylmethionine:tRNA ribosyltransferase-isomerase [Candidatus Eremiobacteraeota bacterium]PZR60797.1 MAG: queuosine biosynthesis protein [Candidatus Eremiobacter sp. RRmetagenome_bin22]
MIEVAQTLEFALPPELEAHEPPEARGIARDGVGMLVSGARRGSNAHASFHDLPDFLEPGDVLVVNTSATLPAALEATSRSGQRIGLHVSTRLAAGLTVVEPRNTAVIEGDVLSLAAGGTVRLLSPYKASQRLWIAAFDLPEPLLTFLAHHGSPIQYPYVRAKWPLEVYQTIFALHPGSAEMPSAGRPFTARVVERLVKKGITIVPLLLHCGVASLERDEPPYSEYFDVSETTVAAVEQARSQHRHVVAVGTTAARALESCFDERGRLVASRGWTDHLITPDVGIRSFDALLTGFHETRSSHLAILQALLGRSGVATAYEAALAHGYLWHEFGDVHLIQQNR